MMFTHLGMVDSEWKRQRLFRFLWYHLPVILYAAAILAVSSLGNLRTPKMKLIAFDKVAHFLEYAIFGILTYRSFSHLRWTSGTKRTILFSIIFLAIFAVINELFQSMIPGRSSDIYDVLADLGGAVLVLVILLLWRLRQKTGS